MEKVVLQATVKEVHQLETPISIHQPGSRCPTAAEGLLLYHHHPAGHEWQETGTPNHQTTKPVKNSLQTKRGDLPYVDEDRT